MEKTNISKIGKYKLIELITKDFKRRHESSKLSIGDDAALIDIGNAYSVLSSDMIVENVNFDLTFFPLNHLGYKSVIIGISDILAMNAEAKQIIVNIGLSSKFTLEAVKELYEGIKIACDQYNLDLIGGDTCSSEKGLIISITAIGICNKNEVSMRSGAKVNDIICVSGDLGAAFLGLKLLTREKKIFKENPEIQPELKSKYVLQRYLKPSARINVINKLKQKSIIPTSMIDISAGLASDLMQISKMSGVGVHIFEDKLPISEETYKVAAEFNISPLVSALNGGEDYELLFTITPDDYDKIKDEKDISVIGYINEKSDENYLVTKLKEFIKLEV